jgi:hypothetical protein
VDRAGDEGRHDLTSTPDLAGERPAASHSPDADAAAPVVARRAPVWLLLHLATLVVAAAMLLWFNRNQWFFGDEWEFIVNRGLVDSRLGLWYPHNEHLSTLPILAYSALINTFGLGSYWPYITLLVLVHLVLTHLLWRVMMRAGVAPMIATAGAAVFAVLGAGAENLLWAFQIGFIGSLAFGWAAALVVDRSDRLCRRDAWAVVLLIAALMCSGIGVPAVAIVTLLALARARGLLRPLVVGGIPTALFGIWYLLAPQPPKPPWETAADGGALSLVSYVVRSLRDVLTASTDLPGIVALVLIAAAFGFALWMTAQIILRRPGAVDTAIALVGLYGTAGFLLMSGFGRGGDGTASRYVYVAMALALPGLMLAVSKLARPVWAQAVVVAALAVVLVINVMTLREWSHGEADREQAAKQTIIAAEQLLSDSEQIIGEQPEPTFNPDITTASLPWLVSQGLPLDALTPQGLASARLGLQVDIDAQDASLPGGPPPAIEDLAEASITDEPASATGVRCIEVTATGGDPHLVLIAPGGLTTLSVGSDVGGPFAVALQSDLDAGQRVDVLQPGETRYVQTTLPEGTAIRLTLAMPESVVCGVA